MDAIWRAALKRLARTGSLILAHHGVGDVPRSEDPLLLRVSPARLRRQLELLDDAGFAFRTVDGLMAEIGPDGRPPPGLAALSFDDGMEDNHSQALPLLRELGVPATVYVATGYIGARNPWLPPATGERMLRPEELRELAAAGIELGGHTVSHPDLSTLTYDACLEEIVRGREQLEAASGVRATTFAYPFGRMHADARRAVIDAGFTGAVTCNGYGSDHDRFALRRELFWGTDDAAVFVAKAAGIFQPVFDHPAVAVARGATRGLRHRTRTALQARRG